MVMQRFIRHSSIAALQLQHRGGSALQTKFEGILISSGGNLPTARVAPGTLGSTRSFLDIHKLGNRAAIEKEKARLADELNRGYFADIHEFNKHGGKLAMANKTIIPSVVAVKFPDLEVSTSDGKNFKLPITSSQNESKLTFPCATLLCLSFRASSQAMTQSWSRPFFDAFSSSGHIQIYEMEKQIMTSKLDKVIDSFKNSVGSLAYLVSTYQGRSLGIYKVSFVDSWFLSLSPIKRLMLRIMKKSCSPQEQIVYSFGDHYDFRKSLSILNLLTGYAFLLDRFGRIRWQGFGLATNEEVSSLLSATSQLLDEK